MPQLIVMTHSFHVLEPVNFDKVRHFQRCHALGDDRNARVHNASVIRNLHAFRPQTREGAEGKADPDDTLAFLKKYLRLTHCDIFFADAIILVEGAVEKILLPAMIARSAPGLRKAYLTILEVGGAYAHRFEDLLAFLHVPYLVITDLDSAEPSGRLNACRADKQGARTSNATLRALLGKTTIEELMAIQEGDKATSDNDRFVAYQFDIPVTDGTSTIMMRTRTLEEAIVYQNFSFFSDGIVELGVEVPAPLNNAYEAVYSHIRSSNFKKTDFAMDILACKSDWLTPNYIHQGLRWLQHRVVPTEKSGS